MAIRTQRQVIESITTEAARVLRKQEDQDVQALLKAYQTAQEDIANTVRTAYGQGTWSFATVAGSPRGKNMMTQIGKQITTLKAQTNKTIESAAVKQYQTSYLYSGYMLDQATPPTVAIGMDAIPEAGVTALVNTEFQGAMFSQRIGAINDAMASDIRDDLTQSLINGESMDDATDRITDVLGAYDLGGPMGYAARAEMIARTEIMRAMGLARDAIYDQNRDIMEDGDEWLATPDDRLCPYCMDRDGKTSKEFKMRSGDPWGKSFVTPLHPRCRCTKIPRLKSWQSLLGY